METKNQIPSQAELSKQALRTFLSAASIVFIAVLAYCYFTKHFFEMTVVGSAVLGLAILATIVYRSLGVTTEKIQTKTYNYDTFTEPALRNG